MEKAKIDRVQFLVLLLLFEMGTSIVVTFGISAGRDAWLAIFFGSLAGCVFFLIYSQLYQLFPEDSFIGYVKKILGKWLGTPVSFIYVVVALYISTRVLRDFGEVLLASSYPETPMCIINAMIILVVIYGVNKGIETIARTAEINFLVVLILAFLMIILIWLTNDIDPDRIRPILENGWQPVLKSVVTETMNVPFGEVIIFTALFPYLNNDKRVKLIGVGGMFLSGFLLAATMAMNILILGFHVVEDSAFPLLATIQMISVADFLERLDVLFLIVFFIGVFFKLTLFFYFAVIGLAELFRLESYKQITYPMGIIVLFYSLTIATNYSEFANQGVMFVSRYISFPLQVIIPSILLVVAYWKKRRQQGGNNMNQFDKQDKMNSSTS